MKYVYVAGPFSAKTREGVEANILAAQLLGVEVAKLGAYPVIPHANTSHPDFEVVQPYAFWIEGTMWQLRQCDAVMLTPNWESSSGARGEVADAQARGVPVFTSLDDLKAWLAA